MVSQQAMTGQIDRECEPTLTGQDLAVIADVERALADGLRLKQWWEQTDAANSYADRFQPVRTFNKADRVIGFFDTIVLNGKDFPMMGIVQEMLFDQPKQEAPEKVRDELREFILHYFLRVSSFREPEAYIPRDQSRKSDVRQVLQPFSFCPEPVDTQSGFGYTQLYYKLRGSFVGKFPRHRQPRIVDLRQIGDKYEWIVLQVNLFNFNITYTPFANALLSLLFPLQEATYVAISQDFVTNQDNPTPELLGKYGFGYALLKPAPRKTIFAYGPGYFTAGFQLVDFTIQKNGQSHARMAFVSNRPERIVSMDIDPVGWGFRLADVMSFGLASRFFGPAMTLVERLAPRIKDFDPVTAYITLANMLTGGVAATDLCASLEALEKDPMLLTHFMEHYRLLVGALMTWRRVQSWLDTAYLPEGIKEGTSF